MYKNLSRNDSRRFRHKRVRKKISGTSDCPRVVVFRSNRHIYAQAIDDFHGVTIASSSTLQLKTEVFNKKNAAYCVGSGIAASLSALYISRIVFDRGGYIFHGRVKEVADALREKGLVF